MRVHSHSYTRKRLRSDPGVKKINIIEYTEKKGNQGCKFYRKGSLYTIQYNMLYCLTSQMGVFYVIR